MPSSIRHLAGRAAGKLARTLLPPPIPETRGAAPVDPDAFTIPPWEPMAPTAASAMCPVCRWEGDAFEGLAHVELSLCPSCRANGRDRFLHWCMAQRVELHPGLRIVECSPGLGELYQTAMAGWFFYRASDFDQRSHRSRLRLDLQAIDLPDGCIDVLLCAHVLEHVPDTDKALAELRRVLAPGGHLLLQVPLLQGRTAPPATPEFHQDNTPVFWRFGFDLTVRLRDHGFETSLLCVEELADTVRAGTNPWTEWSAEFDVPDILAGAVLADLEVVADRDQASRLGLMPGYMYFTWDCRVPDG